MKYEFVTIIAHKFRTPLTQIKWLLESILSDEEDSFKKESLQNIGKSTETLIGLTNALVELTNSADNVKSIYNFEKINICEMVKKVSGLLSVHFHEKNIFFGIEYSSPEIYVNADHSRMEFVLQTLFENSINYSHTGRNVDIQVLQEKNKVIISVVDYGIGIDPSDLPRIFSKFFRASNARNMDTEGFGVGLYLVKSVVKRHHGTLEVFSDGIEKGTTFVLTLPIYK